MSSAGVSLRRFNVFVWFSLAVLPFLAEAQVPRDREPMGPSSRRTGLVISEIMYHPYEALTTATQSLEFIEVHNTNPWEENISGFLLDGSVTFRFPAGTILPGKGQAVVARQPEFLQAHYSITNVLGPWDGASTNRLPTTSGMVRLRNRQGAVLLTVEYGDVTPWPISADGPGHSMVLSRPSFGENDPRAWSQSDRVGGSPGAADPVTSDPLDALVINEWLAHTDLPLRDYIELYNHSNLPVDVSGAWLSDDPDTNKFRIPDGTIIGPRGYLWYDDSTLPFSLLSEGEQIFLVNSNQTRVIDAIDFRGQSNAVASGRWPDGGNHHYVLQSRTPGARNSQPLRFGVVINEIMYNPVSGEEYVEIYNRGAAPANISQWEFVNGIDYTFPSNTVMPAGAHWVVAANPNDLFAIYPNLNTNNTFGPYDGTLANGGERLTLTAADFGFMLIGNQNVLVKLPVIASEVYYGDGGKWGDWSDGAGSSLELIDPEADTHHPSNWADSDSGSLSEWTAIEYNGPFGETLGPNPMDALIFGLQGVGECLIDEVEVRVDGGPNLVVNGGFEEGLSAWTLQGSHDFSAIEDEGFTGGKSLHVRAASRGDNQSNRILSAPFAQPISPTAGTVSIRAKARWLRGNAELLLRLKGGGAEAYGQLAVPERLGTPGMTNSTRIANAGPAIYEVQHAPTLPQGGELLLVTARAADPQGVSSLTVRYRIDPDPNYQTATMLDNGTAGDAIAADGIYTGSIPAQPIGTIVAFYVNAVDGAGKAATFPKNIFPATGFTRCWPNDAVARECVVRFGEVQMAGDFATYHLWVTAVNSNRWHHRDTMNNTELDGTFIYNNSRVVYNALPLFSGSPWHRAQATDGPAGRYRVDYEMNFPEDENLLGVQDFVLANPGNPTLEELSDLGAVAEQTVYKMLDDLDLVFNNRRYIHLFINGSQRSKTPQRAGNFIFEDAQQPSSEMTDQWFPDLARGDLFKVDDWFEFDRNGFDIVANNDADLTRRTVMLNGQPTLTPLPYRYMFRKRAVAAGGSANSFASLFNLINAVSPAHDPNSATVDPVAFGEVANWEDWMRIFAVQRTVGNWDSYGWERGKNDYLYQAGGQFYHMTWDIDYSLGLGRPANEPLFGSNDPRVEAMFNTPAIVRAYWRAFNELVEGPFRNENLDPFIDSRVAALLANNVDIDLNAVAAIKTFIGERRAFIQGQLASVAAPFAITGETNFSTAENLLLITGTAPVLVKEITVNGEVYPVVWTSVTGFSLRVVLKPGTNVVQLAGIDRFGNPMPGATTELNVTYTGLLVEPADALAISEIMYLPTVSGAQFLEILNRSPISFDLSRWRLDGVDFEFPVGSVTTNGQRIVLVRNNAAFVEAYGRQPIYGEFNSNLLPSGEIIALVTADNMFVDGVRYEAALPWPVVIPGQSLQLVDAAQDNSRVSNWAAETPTPNAANSVAAVLPAYEAIWLNEVQSENLAGPQDGEAEREPWIELYNSGTTPVNLSGWSLGSDYTNSLTHWTFPEGTTIAPGEFLLVWADAEPSDTNLHVNFRLDYSGQIALSRLVGGQPQIVDYLTFAEPGPNASYGSFPDGQAVYRSVLFDPTARGTNVTRAFPVVINEFMARNTAVIRDPADNEFDDWFELYNASDNFVDLSGCYLSDNSLATKFRIPISDRSVMLPRSYWLVWADDEANQNSPSRPDLHVNFNLSANSGLISLYGPDGVTPLDVMHYGLQATNVSEGRYTDAASAIYTMSKPTPRSRNTIPGYNTPPAFQFVPDVVAVRGQNVGFQLRVQNPEAPEQLVRFAVDYGPPGAAVNLAGAFRWIVPTNQPAGVYPIQVSVADNGTPPRSDTEQFNITVVVPGEGPTATAPVIYALSSPNGQVTFTFAATPGSTYRVTYKDDLSVTDWTQLGPDFVTANPYASITDTISGPQRFYRVALVE